MPEPSLFRHYQIVQDADGNNVELLRSPEQVAVLAFDTRNLEFVHCHVMLEPLGEYGQAFRQNAEKLQHSGHPLLARLLDFGEDEGNPFYITSNVDGETVHAYLSRQQDLPAWLAGALACRVLDAVLAASEKGDFLLQPVRESLRILQTGPQNIEVVAADYQLRRIASPVRRPAFDKPAKALRDFLQAQDNPLHPDHPLRAADFSELLEACLAAVGPGVAAAIRELRTALAKLVPDHVTGEIATANKPRALLAPQLASYQEVARTVVNLVRIQSQRLDMANPYAMRGTLTKTGRPVSVEQVLPERLCGSHLRRAYEKVHQVSQRREIPSLVPVALLHESDGVTCMAEEIVEGISLADLMRERRYLGVKEVYLVLAGLDATLSRVESADLKPRRLRLEDIFILTGFPRDDPRTMKLMLTKLHEWPAFSLMVRGHATLASVAGRGTDPAVLLPPKEPSAGSSPWHAGWLAALARFLLGLEAIPGIHANPQGAARDRDTISRLCEEELHNATAGDAGDRADFLARYARLIHHSDQVKPLGPPSGPLVAPLPKPERSATIPITRSLREEPIVVAKPTPAPIAGALTSGSSAAPEKPTIGFAELLFRGTSEDTVHTAHTSWTKMAEDAPPTIHPGEALLPPREYVPLWLRSAVFIGGSMVLGALIAHLSGEATWQRQPKTPEPAANPSPPRAAAATPSAPAVRPAAPASPTPEASPPAPTPAPAAARAGFVSPQADRETLPAPTLPPEHVPATSGLEMRPPAPLKDLLTEPSGPSPTK